LGRDRTRRQIHDSIGKKGHEKKQGQNKRAGTGQKGRDKARCQGQDRQGQYL
jgi:hypothetical protein